MPTNDESASANHNMAGAKAWFVPTTRAAGAEAEAARGRARSVALFHL